MKDWKFVALWAFILISGELIVYARYYIFFYRPYVPYPFRLIGVVHSSAMGIEREDERYGWHYTVQYAAGINDYTLEDVTITWWRTPYTFVQDYHYPIGISSPIKESKYMERLPPGETFTVWTFEPFVIVTITYQFSIRHHPVIDTVDFRLDADSTLDKIPTE
ncbi:MAG: hypothetical protein ACETWE_03270 [Candidatus Bathyarchaeia archaeon]